MTISVCPKQVGHSLPILPLTFKLFFIFTEVSQCRDSGPGGGLRKPPLLVMQNRAPFILSVALALLRQHREMTACFLYVVLDW